MNRVCDLHIHTHFSDGTMTPVEVVHAAKEYGLAAISISDHDTVDAVVPAQEEGDRVGLEVIPGVELSSDYQDKDIHILGYFFELSDSPIVQQLGAMQNERQNRARKMVEILQDMGMTKLDFEEVAAKTKSDSVGRPHVAQSLLEYGYVKNIGEAFDKYLAEGRPAYFPKFKQTPFEAIKLIKDSGGLAVLAHPMLNRNDDIIPFLVESGLDGLECYYPNCSMNVIQSYLDLCEKYDLIVTGGSDAHGDNKSSTHIGKGYVDYSWVEKMKERLGKS